MAVRAALGVLLGVLSAAAARAERVPDGWLTAVDGNAAMRVAKDYANNGVRCAWAGDVRNVAAAMPANVPFQFAVAGTEQSVSNVQAILDEAAAAIPTNLLPVVRRFRLLGPTVQWMVRSARCRKPNRADYLGGANHPAAFAETDFNRTNLLALARGLAPEQLPPAAAIRLEGEETVRRQALSPTIPGVDYPGVSPEVTFAAPFGIGMVVRAPESPRVFRVRAAAFPASGAPVSFAWVALTSGAQVQSWDGRRQARNGYGRIVLDVGTLCARKRIDVAVFCRWGEGPWGAPSVISFYISPYEVRTYRKDELVSIQYLPAVRMPPPYDVSAICVPAEWTDNYQHDEKNQIVGFSRLLPDGVTEEEFSACNELIVESHPNGTAKIAEKINYFVRDGRLQYGETGEEVSYKLKTFTPRRWLSRLGSNQD